MPTEKKPLAVLVGHDAAPSKAFELVKTALENMGWGVAPFLGHGKLSLADMWKSIRDEMIRADAVLVGMSVPQNNALEEIGAAGLAAHLGKPFGLYADAFGRSLQEYFSHLRDRAKFLFVLNEAERQVAIGAGYYEDAVVISGNQDWETGSFPKYSRSEVREILGISRQERFVLVYGHKEMVISAYALASAVHALHQLPLKDHRWRVIFSPHPGDGVPPQSYKAAVLYSNIRVEIVAAKNKSEFVTYAKRLDEGKKEAVFEERAGGLSADDMLSGADFVVESVSTGAQPAAIMGIPVFSVVTEITKNRNPLYMGGKREFELVNQGVAKEAYGSANDLVALFTGLLNPARYSEFGMHQRSVYPAFKEKGEFAKRIAAKLNSFR